jgi:uncharacterized protein (DUF1778 family)
MMKPLSTTYVQFIVERAALKLINEAAASQRVNRSQFIRAAALKAAMEVLKDKEGTCSVSR